MAQKKPAKAKPKTSKVTPRTLRTMDRAATALDMKREGFSYDAIGKKLGISRQAAWALIQKRFAELRAQTEESACDVRDQMLLRLDGMLCALRNGVKRGDPRTIDTALRIEERRARLLGMDAPSRAEVSGPDGRAIEIDDARGQLAEALARLAPPDESEPGSAGDIDAAERSGSATPV
jgi:hypothetical protein